MTNKKTFFAISTIAAAALYVMFVCSKSDTPTSQKTHSVSASNSERTEISSSSLADRQKTPGIEPTLTKQDQSKVADDSTKLSSYLTSQRNLSDEELSAALEEAKSAIAESGLIDKANENGLSVNEMSELEDLLSKAEALEMLTIERQLSLVENEFNKHFSSDQGGIQ